MAGLCPHWGGFGVCLCPRSSAGARRPEAPALPQLRVRVLDTRPATVLTTRHPSWFPGLSCSARSGALLCVRASGQPRPAAASSELARLDPSFLCQSCPCRRPPRLRHSRMWRARSSPLLPGYRPVPRPRSPPPPRAPPRPPPAATPRTCHVRQRSTARPLNYEISFSDSISYPVGSVYLTNVLRACHGPDILPGQNKHEIPAVGSFHT